MLEVCDSVMTDKGFKIYKKLEERDVSLNIPSSLSRKSQFSVAEVVKTQGIATLRIHVDRAIERILLWVRLLLRWFDMKPRSDTR